MTWTVIFTVQYLSTVVITFDFSPLLFKLVLFIFFVPLPCYVTTPSLKKIHGKKKVACVPGKKQKNRVKKKQRKIPQSFLSF